MFSYFPFAWKVAYFALFCSLVFSFCFLAMMCIVSISFLSGQNVTTTAPQAAIRFFPAH